MTEPPKTATRPTPAADEELVLDTAKVLRIMAVITFLLLCASCYFPLYSTKVLILTSIDTTSTQSNTLYLLRLLWISATLPSPLCIVIGFVGWLSFVTAVVGVGLQLCNRGYWAAIAGLEACFLCSLFVLELTMTLFFVLLGFFPLSLFFLEDVQEFHLGAGFYCWYLSTFLLMLSGLLVRSSATDSV